MSDYLKAAIIGVVEGLTEFLPVSSTAHIRLAQDWLGIAREDEYWKMFAIVIQLGAILSVVVYFRTRIIEFLKSYPRGVGVPPARKEPDSSRGQDAPATTLEYADPQLPQARTWWNHPLALVIIAFVVTAVPCYLIDKKIGDNLESMLIIGWSLVIGGVLMWVIDWHYSKRAKTLSMDNMTLLQAVVIGFTQIFAAAFPGTSRSMATIAGGQIMGLSRTAALEFSFFLSIPVMFAATGFKLLQFMVKSPVAMTGHQWGVLAVGFVVSFLVAWAVIAWFMAWVRKRGFVPFAVYRIIIGTAVLVWAYRAM